MTIVKTVQLEKTYGSGENAVRALLPCDLEFQQGSFTAIVGRSGSGKSTLMHLLGGLDKPTAGDTLIEGHSIHTMGDRQQTVFRRRRIGFVFQSYNLMPELTAKQNILLPLTLDKRAIDRAYFKEVTDFLGLGDRLSHYAGELSGGQQQRVAIARALIAKPAIILADEPTGNLDGKSGAEVLELLHSTRRLFDQTLIMVTHDRQIAEGADRMITLEDGAVAGDTAAKGGRI